MLKRKKFLHSTPIANVPSPELKKIKLPQYKQCVEDKTLSDEDLVHIVTTLAFMSSSSQNGTRNKLVSSLKETLLLYLE